MVGNGVTNWTYDTLPASMEFAYQRGLIDTETHLKLKEYNCDLSMVSPVGENTTTPECLNLVSRWA